MSHRSTTFSFKLASSRWEFLGVQSHTDGVSIFHNDIQRNAATGTTLKWWPQLEIYLHCMSLWYGICLCNNYSSAVHIALKVLKLMRPFYVRLPHAHYTEIWELSFEECRKENYTVMSKLQPTHALSTTWMSVVSLLQVNNWAETHWIHPGRR